MANLEAKFVADMKAAHTPMFAPTGHFLAIPDDYSIADLEHVQAHPNRARTNYQFRDTSSLAAYLKRFQRKETIAFSSPTAREIKVLIDHHNHIDGLPAHCTHVARFCGQFSEPYKAWREIDKKLMSQVQAGMFLEERAVDVVEPDAASIMDMVMTFDALKKVTFRQSTRLRDGQRQFTYNEENEARGNVTLPESILVRAAVFDGQEPERIKVRIKYRIDDGALRFTFEIHDRQAVEDMAFGRCEDALANQVSEDLLILRVV